MYSDLVNNDCVQKHSYYPHVCMCVQTMVYGSNLYLYIL